MSDNRKTGRIISYIGGILSALFGSFIILPKFRAPLDFGGLAETMENFDIIYTIVAGTVIVGGLITITGAALVNNIGTKSGGALMIIGSLLGGVNILSLIGGIVFLTKSPTEKHIDFKSGTTTKHKSGTAFDIKSEGDTTSKDGPSVNEN